MQTKILKFNKINHELRVISIQEGKEFLAYGILPEEEAEVKVSKRKRGRRFVKPVRILSKSKYRIDPVEDHYLTCSPLQHIDYDYQIELKENALNDLFSDLNIRVSQFYNADEIFNYRNKLEFSFYGDESNRIHLAFHRRDTKFGKDILNSGCALGSDSMNKTGLKIVEVLNRYHIEARSLKTLTVRESKYNNKVITVLLIKDEDFIQKHSQDIDNLFNDLKNTSNGIVVGYSSPKSPASNIDNILFQSGDEYLEEKINDKTIRYRYDSFFQNNIPMFEKSLKEIIDSIDNSNRIVELYSGVGTIGLNLVNKAKEVIGVEVSESSVEYSKLNAESNNIENYTALKLESENISPEVLNNSDVLVLDPPRSGLHPRVIEMILEKKPKRVIYLSCNPITQARDVKLLTGYKIDRLSGFDFYPNTPHMESLAILDLN